MSSDEDDEHMHTASSDDDDAGAYAYESMGEESGDDGGAADPPQRETDDDLVDRDVARCCGRFGDDAAVRSGNSVGRTFVLALRIDCEDSGVSPETRQAWGFTRPLVARLKFSGGASQYVGGTVDAVVVESEGAAEAAERAAAEQAAKAEEDAARDPLREVLAGAGRRPPPAPKAVTPEKKEADAGDPCIVAQQLARILEAFWGPENAARRSGHDGAVAATLAEARRRLPTLADRCAICDGTHAFGAASLLPTVCTRPLCAFQLQTFGKMLVGATCLATRAEVLDLLVATTTLAARHARAPDVLKPPCELDGKLQTHATAAAILARFPSFEAIHAAALGGDGGGMAAVERTLTEADPRAPALLRWVLTSNRAHLVSLPPAQRLQKVGACRQFVMLSASPEKQARFHALKARHGSRFAWHGSRPENWHAILRQGLRNASGTKLQLNGAAHGQGIYLSTALSYSEHYSQVLGPRGGAAAAPAAAPASSSAFLSGRDLRIIALCEVAEVPHIRKSHNIWVVPDEDAVATRFLLVFENGFDPRTGGRAALYGENTLDATFEAEARACVAAQLPAGHDEASVRSAPPAPAPAPKRAHTLDVGAKPAWFGKQGVPRMMAEFRALRGWAGAPRVYDVDMVGDRADLWRFKVQGFDGDCAAGAALNDDLQRLSRRPRGADHICMELSFPGDYPTRPFFVRCVYPRFKWYTGHVTAGGAICIEALTTTGGAGAWRATFSVETVLHTVFANMLHCEETVVRTATGPGGRTGPLRVDLNGEYGRDAMAEYSQHEAKSAFDRMLRHHAANGW